MHRLRHRLLVALLLATAAPLGAAPLPHVVELSVATANSAVDTVSCVPPLSGNGCFLARWGQAPAPITDNATSTYAFTLGAYPTGYSDCVINDANVAVYLTHPFTGDLEVSAARGSDAKLLWTGFGTCTGTTINANFDDRAVTVANTCPAAAGYFLPNDALASWAGQGPLASYTLTVRDTAGGNAGTLQNWGVALDVTCTTVPSPTGCQPDAHAVCLTGGRFKVSLTYQAPGQAQGDAAANTLTTDTGWFWFFNPANVESIVKVLNGCGTNNRYWVFASGLTNVKVGITVEDTRTGFHKTYSNPQGTAFKAIQDTSAFATCP